MNNIRFFLAVTSTGILAFALGCSRSERGDASADARTFSRSDIDTEFETLTQLTKRDRNSVHVAIWTIKTHDVKIPVEVDFEASYADNSTALESLVAELGKLGVAERRQLDQSLAYHWQIYSPIWGPEADHWE